MAYASWDMVSTVIRDRGLDRFEATSPDKRSRLYDCEGVEDCQAACDYLRAALTGDVLVTAWRASERKTAAYQWTVRNGGAVGAVSGGPDPSSLWAQLLDAKVAAVRLEHERDQAAEGGLTAIADAARELGPQIIAALLGRRVPAPAPVAGAAPVAGDAVADAELRDALAEVAAFYRRNPEAARGYVETLRKMNDQENG